MAILSFQALNQAAKAAAKKLTDYIKGPATPSTMGPVPQNNLANVTGGVRAPIATPTASNPTVAPKPPAAATPVSAPKPAVTTAAQPTPAVKSPDQIAREKLAMENFAFQKADHSGGAIKAPTATAPTTSPTPPPTPSAATAVPPTAATPDRISQYREAIMNALMPSEEEQAIQRALDTLIGETNQNIAGLEGQGRGITLDIVRGQQGALARQAEAQAQTLEQRIATREANRRAALQAATTALGFETEDQRMAQQQEQQRQQQMQALALQAAQAGASQEEIQGILGSSDFARALGLASPFLTEKEKADLQTVKPGEYLIDPSTGQVVFQAPDMGGGFEGMTPLQQLQYQKLQQEITGTTPEQQQQQAQNVQKSQQIITSVGQLLNHPGLNNAVGGSSLLPTLPGTDKADFENQLNAFKSQVILPELGSLKGALSDKDIQFLQNAVGALGLNMSEEAFKKSLEQIRERSQHVVNKAQLPAPAQEAYDQLRLKDDTLGPEDILDALLAQTPAFNSAQTQALNGSVQIPQSARLAYVNNNPGNLRYVGQAGATLGEGGFARFASPEAGYQALLSQIDLDASRGLTLSQFINKYAPPAENNTNLYLQQVMKQTGATANTPISQIDRNRLGQAIALKESSTRIV